MPLSRRDMTHSCTCHWFDETWLIRVYAIESTRHDSCRYMTLHHISRHDSFIYVPWLIHTCAMTHSYMCHDSFIYVPWLISMRDINYMSLISFDTSLAHLAMCNKSYHKNSVSPKMPYTSVEEPYISAKETYISAKVPYVLPQKPIDFLWHPPRLTCHSHI